MFESLSVRRSTAAALVGAGAVALSLATSVASRSVEAGEEDIVGVDTSFGELGFVHSTVPTNFGFQAPHAAVDAEGRILVLGSRQEPGNPSQEVNVLLRYLPDGTPDPEFGDEGRIDVEIEPPQFIEEFGGLMRTGPFSAVAVQPDGRILLVRGADRDIRFPKDREIVVRRLTADGELDTTYGIDGRAAIPAPDQLPNRGKCPIAVDVSGRLLVAFTHVDAGPPAHSTIRVVRFTTAGEVDGTFGTGGFATLPSTYANWPVAMSLDISQRIVVGGGIDYFNDIPSSQVPFTSRVFLARFKRDGALDPTFDVQGLDDPRFGGAEGQASGIAFDPQGVIVVSTDDGLRRFHEDGEWNRAFAFQSRGGLSVSAGRKGTIAWDRDLGTFEQFSDRFFTPPGEPMATDGFHNVEIGQIVPLSDDAAIAVGQVNTSGVVLVRLVPGGVVGGPDVGARIDSVAVSPRALSGTVTVSCSVRDARATAARWYLSDDDVLDPSDDVLRSTRVGRLRAGESRAARFRVPVKRGVQVNGRFLLVELDANRSLPEAWRVNNVAASAPLQ